jgi:putative cardiolipin synthase
MLTNFRRANQRMHNKTLIVDGTLAVTGGRNMADEYYDFDQAYNFRDRDALVLGSAVQDMQASFERFWGNPLAVPLEQALERRDRHAGDDALIRTDWKWLHDYAADPANFAPDVRRAISAIPSSFVNLARQVTWGEVDFISDLPGKNAGHSGLGGGGLSTTGLRKLLQSAHDEVLIQSPYLVLSDAALAVFRSAIARGVRIRISTNSLASTDNLSAFSGYHRQRARLLAMGLELREYQPYPQVQKDIMDRYQAPRAQRPIFALHAKTMVVDRKALFVGTYNLDPRSENLNTEVGVIIHDAVQASRVALAIETDMAPGNSWNPAVDAPDSAAAFYKRVKVQFLQLLPLQAVL